MNKILSCLLVLFLVLVGTLYHNKTPNSSKVEFTMLLPTSSTLLLPLDSRPPCTDFTVELGHLAGIEVVSPPLNIMDNNETKANTSKLMTWAQENGKTVDSFLISTDLLASGGLLNSRIEPPSTKEEDTVLNFLTTLHNENSAKPFYVFSVIPRLLVSDHLIPDRWYQWHLMIFSELEDKRIQGLSYDKEKYEEYKKEIPPKVLNKYLKIYEENQKFNNKLINLAASENFTDLVIGQDDSREYSLSNHNRIAAKEKTTSLKGSTTSFHTTQGADELGVLAITRMFCTKNNYHPKVFVAWGSPDMRKYILHFVPLTLNEIVEDKIKLVNGTFTENIDEADFILFIHCGNSETKDYTKIADTVKAYMGKKPVALVGLSSNFDASEAILYHLLANRTPLPQLISYAGWNTASNSIGTALSQGVIFTGRKKLLNKNELPAYYAENLKFTLARILDDFIYQKKIRYKISEFDDYNGIDADATDVNTRVVESYIMRQLSIYNFLLLQTNLKHYPFYSSDSAVYYLKDLNFKVSLPWNRIFEIKLEVFPEYGEVQKQKNISILPKH